MVRVQQCDFIIFVNNVRRASGIYFRVIIIFNVLYLTGFPPAAERPIKVYLYADDNVAKNNGKPNESDIQPNYFI